MGSRSLLLRHHPTTCKLLRPDLVDPFRTEGRDSTTALQDTRNTFEPSRTHAVQFMMRKSQGHLYEVVLDRHSNNISVLLHPRLCVHPKNKFCSCLLISRQKTCKDPDDYSQLQAACFFVFLTLGRRPQSCLHFGRAWARLQYHT